MKNTHFLLLALVIAIPACERQESAGEKQKQDTVLNLAKPKTGKSLVAEAREKLAQAKDKLMQEGKYNCCVKDPCNYCLLHESDCDCYKDLQAGEHVCIECYSEWQRGNGAVEGIKKEAVRTDFVKHEHGKH